MLNKQKQLNLLGLATRANKVITGLEGVVQAIRKEEAQLVILAKDLGQASQKKIIDKCTYYQVPYIIFESTLEISAAIGKKRSILAFSDKGFAKSFTQLQENQEEDLKIKK